MGLEDLAYLWKNEQIRKLSQIFKGSLKSYQVLLEVLLVQPVLACKKMGQVQVLFRHLETSGFVPKMVGCQAVVQVDQVVLEFQVVLPVLEVQFLPDVLVHQLVLDLHLLQTTHKLQLAFHLVVG